MDTILTILVVQSKLTTVFLPIALAIVMLGLGLSLTIDDFKRIFVYPKAVFIGLFCQMILLPVLCFFLIKVFNLPPELAVGMMLLAASPGGPTANLFSHLAKGDLALNITLTAVNSIITLISLPIIVNFSLNYFMNSDEELGLQTRKIIEVFMIVLVPVALGMLIRKMNVNLSEKLNKPVKILSALFLLLIIVAAVLKEKENIGTYFQQVGWVALLFNLLSMGIGFYLPQLFKVNFKQRIAIGMEIGVHNGTLAIFIASNALNNSTMSIPPAIYSLIMLLTAALFGYVLNNFSKKINDN